jgi:hypothetical protein
MAWYRDSFTLPYCIRLDIFQIPSFLVLTAWYIGVFVALLKFWQFGDVVHGYSYGVCWLQWLLPQSTSR